jgi:hypothetical protein
MLGFVFSAALAAAGVMSFLDWYRTEKLIAKNGVAGEKNPIMRFFFSKSKWAALAYKAWPMALLGFCWLHYQNGEYTNEHAWAIVWILAALGSAGLDLYGFLKSK